MDYIILSLVVCIFIFIITFIYLLNKTKNYYYNGWNVSTISINPLFGGSSKLDQLYVNFKLEILESIYPKSLNICDLNDLYVYLLSHKGKDTQTSIVTYLNNCLQNLDSTINNDTNEFMRVSTNLRTCVFNSLTFKNIQPINNLNLTEYFTSATEYVDKIFPLDTYAVKITRIMFPIMVLKRIFNGFSNEDLKIFNFLNYSFEVTPPVIPTWQLFGSYLDGGNAYPTTIQEKKIKFSNINDTLCTRWLYIMEINGYNSWIVYSVFIPKNDIKSKHLTFGNGAFTVSKTTNNDIFIYPMASLISEANYSPVENNSIPGEIFELNLNSTKFILYKSESEILREFGFYNPQTWFFALGNKINSATKYMRFKKSDIIYSKITPRKFIYYYSSGNFSYQRFELDIFAVQKQGFLIDEDENYINLGLKLDVPSWNGLTLKVVNIGLELLNIGPLDFEYLYQRNFGPSKPGWVINNNNEILLTVTNSIFKLID